MKGRLRVCHQRQSGPKAFSACCDCPAIDGSPGQRPSAMAAGHRAQHIDMAFWHPTSIFPVFIMGKPHFICK